MGPSVQMLLARELGGEWTCVLYLLLRALLYLMSLYVMLPDVPRSALPPIRFRNVVLPLPDGPIIASTSPGITEPVIPCRISFSIADCRLNWNGRFALQLNLDSIATVCFTSTNCNSNKATDMHKVCIHQSILIEVPQHDFLDHASSALGHIQNNTMMFMNIDESDSGVDGNWSYDTLLQHVRCNWCNSSVALKAQKYLEIWQLTDATGFESCCKPSCKSHYFLIRWETLSQDKLLRCIYALPSRQLPMGACDRHPWLLSSHLGSPQLHAPFQMRGHWTFLS